MYCNKTLFKTMGRQEDSTHLVNKSSPDHFIAPLQKRCYLLMYQLTFSCRQRLHSLRNSTHRQEHGLHE